MPDVSRDLLFLWQVRKSCSDALKGTKAACERYHSRKREADAFPDANPYEVSFQSYLQAMEALLNEAPCLHSLPHSNGELVSLGEWVKRVHDKHTTFDMMGTSSAIGILEASEQAQDFVQAVENMRKRALELCRHLQAWIRKNRDWRDHNAWIACSFDDLTDKQGKHSWTAEALLRGYSLAFKSIADSGESSNNSRLEGLEARITPCISHFPHGVEVDYSVALTAQSGSDGPPMHTTVNSSDEEEGRLNSCLNLRNFFDSDQVESLDPRLIIKFMNDCAGASAELQSVLGCDKVPDGTDESMALDNAEKTISAVLNALDSSSAGFKANRIREEDEIEFEASTAAPIAESV
jgi:hypothetical protein